MVRFIRIRQLLTTSMLLLLALLVVLCQKVEAVQSTERIPVRPTFESAYLINGQTVTMHSARTLEFAIQHRFGKVNSGTFDLLGLYAHANDIRMGLNYYATDRIQIGIGTTKSQMLQDLNWRWLLLQQSRDNVIPVSVLYAGNSAISTRDAPTVYPDLSNRLSYYHELMVARRFNEQFSLQLSGSLAHFNIVEEGQENTNFSLAARSRYALTYALSALLEYEHPLTTHENTSPRPNLGFGLEYATRGHQFQIFMSNFDTLMPQRNLLVHTNQIAEFDFLIGFNIIRRWNL